MSIRFDSATDTMIRSTGLPTIPLTAMCWVYISVDTNNYQTIIRVGGASDSSYIMGTLTDGTTFNLWNGSADFNVGSSLGVGEWHHVAVVIAGTGTDQLLGYLDGALNITTAGDNAVDQLVIGNLSSGEGEPLNGRVAAIKIWSAALSQPEIALEMAQFPPVRLTNINTYTDGIDAANASVNAYGDSWTVSGALTTESDPPISLGGVSYTQLQQTTRGLNRGLIVGAS